MLTIMTLPPTYEPDEDDELTFNTTRRTYLILQHGEHESRSPKVY
jgi:hypothetical protein